MAPGTLRLAVVLAAAALGAPAIGRAQAPAAAEPPASAAARPPRLRMVMPGCRPEDIDVDALLAALQVELGNRPMTIDLTVPSDPHARADGPEIVAVLALRFPACDTTRALLTLDDRQLRRIVRRAMDLRGVEPPLRARAIALGIAELLREPPGGASQPASAQALAPVDFAPPTPAPGRGPAARRGPAAPRFWVGFGLGTGVGVVGGHSDCAWNEGMQGDGRNYSGYCVTWAGSKKTPLSTGLGWAPLHLTPEVGLLVTDRVGLSLLGRLQVATFADSGAKETAFAVLARGHYLFGSERLRWHATLNLGGGAVRYRAPLGQVATAADDPALQARRIVDTVRGGVVLVGPGIGVTYALSPLLGLTAEANGLATAPDASFVVDLSVGVRLRF